jgi:AcrR family transcriptional regulator
MTSLESATRRRRRDGEETRQRIIQAVVDTILEQGYYKASSNEIARRAGVTWGAIQHLFGSREALMIAVLEERWHQLNDRIASADIPHGSLETRLRGVLDVLASYYESKDHLAQIQILLDFTCNPVTTSETRRVIRRHGEELNSTWRPLFAQALGAAADEFDLVVYAFTTLRGYLATRNIAETIADLPDDEMQRRLLVDGVARALRAEARRRQIQLR